MFSWQIYESKFSYVRRESMAIPTLISLKLTNSQSHYIQVCHTDYHPDWPLNVESMGRSSFAPYKYGCHCASFYKSCCSIHFCLRLPYRIVSRLDKKTLENRDRIPCTPISNIRLSLCPFV